MPAVLSFFAAFVGLQATAELFPDFLSFFSSPLTNMILSVIAGVIFSIAVPLKAIFADHRTFVADNRANFNQMDQPKGNMGRKLEDVIRATWVAAGWNKDTSPSVRLNPNPNVLARVHEVDSENAIEISKGLWRRLVRQDELGLTIIRHEFAHIVYRDRRTIHRLSLLAEGTLAALRSTLKFALISLAIVLLATTTDSFPNEDSVPVVGATRTVAAVLFLAFFILIAIPLSMIFVRRHIGFLFCLIEVRADIAAGIWGNGLVRFSRSLETDKGIRPTGLFEFMKAHISPSVTHLPTRTRVEILSDMDLIVTPKIRYFVASIALLWLLPVAAGIHLIAGGAIDHLLLTVIVVSFVLTVVLMLVSGQSRTPLSWPRSFTVGTAVVCAQAVPHVNLGSVGYLLLHLGASIVIPGGFEGGATDAASIMSDVSVTGRDIASNIYQVTGGLQIVVAAIIASLAVRFISKISTYGTNDRPGRWVEIAASIAVISVGITASHDQWRGMIVPFFVDGLPSLFSFPIVRLPSTVLAASAVILFVRLLIILSRKKSNQSNRPH